MAMSNLKNNQTKNFLLCHAENTKKAEYERDIIC